MSMYDTLSIINLVVLVGITLYYCFKREKKAVVYNLIVLSLFMLVRVVQSNYSFIRSQLFELFGEEQFLLIRNILSVTLFFGSSVSVGIQILARLISFIVFLFVAAKAIEIIGKKFTKKAFSRTVLLKNDKAQDVHVCYFSKSFLVLKRLLN